MLELSKEKHLLPLYLGSKLVELKMIFGFSKEQFWQNALHCISEAHTGAGARVFVGK